MSAPQAHDDSVRNALLDACSRVLARVGYDRLTTRLITEEAGLSPGKLFEFFDGKDDVVIALAERAEANVLTELMAEDPEQEIGAELLPRVLQSLATSSRDFRDQPSEDELGMTSTVHLAARAMNDERVAASMRRYYNYVAGMVGDIVSVAIHDGIVSDDFEPQALVEAVHCFEEGLGLRTASKSCVTSPEQIQAAFYRMVLVGTLTEQAKGIGLADMLESHLASQRPELHVVPDVGEDSD